MRIEKESILQFNIAVDKILEGQPIGSTSSLVEDQELLKVAGKLAAHSTTTMNEVETFLRQHLLERISERKRNREAPKRFTLRQPATIVLVVLTLLIIGTLTIPPVRAFAQDVLNRIGNFIFTNQPSDAEIYVATMQSGTPTPTVDPSQVCTNCQQVFESESLSITEASQKAGFPVFAASYIPDGYQSNASDVLFTGQTITVDTSYRMELDLPLYDGLQTAGIIAIEQTLLHDNANPWVSGIGDIPLVEVTIHGERGVWIEQIPVYPYQDEQGKWDYARWNQLIWEEDGYNFVLQTNMPSDQLSMEEMLKIAESLRP